MTVQLDRATIENLYREANLGDPERARAQLKGAPGVGNHRLEEPFDDAAVDRMLHDSVQLMKLPAERARFESDRKLHPLFQAMRFEVLRRAGVQTLLSGAELATWMKQNPTFVGFVNSMCGCASGSVNEAIAAVAREGVSKPIVAVMDLGGCGGDPADASTAGLASSAEESRAVDALRQVLAGKIATEDLHNTPAFVSFEAGSFASFAGRVALDKQPVPVVSELLRKMVA